jgi:nitroreductase
MDVYSSIFTRKSIRKFDLTPLTADTIKRLESFIDGIKPLLPDVKLTYKIVGPDGAKGMAIPKAPHYLLIYGEKHPLRNTCAGFLFQHAELYLYSLGYATRWLSTLKGKQPDPNYILGFAFGKLAEPAARKVNEFVRKPLSEIASGSDPRFEAVRLAPSGMNGQPWYFIATGKVVHVYYKKSLGGINGLLYHCTDLDLGLALCHMAVASDNKGIPFKFIADGQNAPMPPKGFTYAGTVE